MSAYVIAGIAVCFSIVAFMWIFFPRQRCEHSWETWERWRYLGVGCNDAFKKAQFCAKCGAQRY